MLRAAMADAGHPFAPPRAEAGPSVGSGAPRPEDILATYEGSGRGRETWRLSITPQRLFFQVEETDEILALDRAGFVEGVNVGVLSNVRVGLYIKQPERRVVNLPRAALDHIRTWLGPERLMQFQARVLRAGWTATAIVGALFLIPVGPQGWIGYLGLAAGAALVVAGLVSRFMPTRAAFLLRALGWALLAAGLVLDVAEGGRTRWMLVLVGLLLFSVVRYVRWFAFFAGRSGAPAPMGESGDLGEDSLG